LAENNAEQSPSANGGIMRISDAETAFLHIIDTSRLLKLLRDDDRAILTAAARAEEASSLLLKLGGRGIADIDEASAAALAA